MYQGANKGSGAVIGWGAGVAPDSDQLIDADESFETSNGNEAVICVDPDGGMLIAVAHLSNKDGSLQWSQAADPEAVLRRYKFDSILLKC